MPESPDSPISLTLPYPPSANRYWRTRAIMPKGKRSFASTYVSAEAVAYKNSVRVICLQNGISRPLSGPVVVTLKLYRPQRTGDLDNRIKVSLDALQNSVYLDDDQIEEIHAYRYDDKNQPRLEVIIHQLTNQEQLL